MASFHIELPDEIAEYLEPGELQEKIREWTVVELAREHRVTHSRGAELLDMAYDFEMLIGSRGVPAIDYEENWWKHDALVRDWNNRQVVKDK